MNGTRTFVLVALVALLLAIPAAAKAPLQPLFTLHALTKKYGKPIHSSTSVDKKGYIFNCAVWLARNGFVNECVIVGQVTLPRHKHVVPKPKAPGA
jgi:hypothetical protein